MYLSKSKYCQAYQCLKQLWLNENKPEEKEEISNESVLENGTNVGIIAKDLLGPSIDIAFNKNLQIMLEDTKKVLTKIIMKFMK